MLSPHLTHASAFSPASVGNIGVGFDLLGHPIIGLGDTVHVRRIDAPDVRIAAIVGDLPGIHRIPRKAACNTAGRALQSLRAQLALPFGFEITIEKGIPLGSGLGGSAASCVAALVAANALLAEPLPRSALYAAAMDGEEVASHSRQGDNIAPMLLGGVVLADATGMVPLATPDWLHVAVVHPDYILETKHARAVLVEPFALADVVRHCGHLALFLTGLAQGNRQLIRAGLRDCLIEPRRAPLVPGFAAVKAAALAHGALGASLSGAGPSVFAWFDSATAATQAACAMQQAFADAGLHARAYTSPVAAPAAQLIAQQ